MDASLQLEGGDLDEDKLFCAVPGGDPSSSLPNLQFDVYSLRADEADIYRKVTAVLSDMAGITVPEYMLELLQTMHEEFDLVEDKARRLLFEIDNKILKNLQAMHRAQMCDRVKGFDLKLAKVMSTLFQHYHNSVSEMPDNILEKMVPSWPDQMQAVPVEHVKILNQPFKPSKADAEEAVNLVESEMNLDDSHEAFPDPPSEMPPLASPSMDIPKVVTSQILPFEKVQLPDTSLISEQVSGFFSPPVVQPKSVTIQLPAGTSSAPTEGPSMFSVEQKEKKYSALEYGLTFDIFSPEPQIFSVYLNPKLDYTSEPKEAPADPESSTAEEVGQDSPSEIWKNLKKITTRVTRTLRGNPKYFVTAQHLQADARDR
ncbi:hypothetical protein RvY_00009 [Ramazzottius varieornatus]|uniref:Uncharacterized protein n=1 Tax=Ramazzottius varieornatus TaxID=947166 RepID=A0A1D1UHJ6_RAMVA|nr:hypothetical protein RvY_00009 [Ramazzottius varieornatus]